MQQRQPQSSVIPHIAVLAPVSGSHEAILTPDALAFIASLHEKFNTRRLQLLTHRVTRQQAIDAGHLPDFLPETENIRNAEWQVDPAPADLQDRRVEITGPVDRKMIINALNSGASCFMADFEDATTPTWENLLDGQCNIHDAVRRTISYTDPASGKHYALNPAIATLIVRPRGWHLDEKHITVNQQPLSGSLFDFGLHMFHNAHAAREQGSGAYFYLPKLESHKEAQLWQDVLTFSEQALALPEGSTKCTVLIETILATFEMEEILHALRNHIVGLNCGRWDYIFSYIKKFRNDPNRVLPERAQVPMTAPLMRAYSRLLIETCHKRGAHAIGGMAAQIPIKGDDAANTAALDKVRADKLREATDGHDGTWVAHPALVAVARAVFDEHMPAANQLHKRSGFTATATELLAVPAGSITEAGVRNNIQVGIHYLHAWLNGQGCVPLNNLMEDAATAEICRAQLWQWLRHQALLDSGQPVTHDWFNTVYQQETARLGNDTTQAQKMFHTMCTSSTFNDFLTLPAYDLLH